jgi:adenylate kinase
MYALSILGPPGAGKGTLARQLCSVLDLVHLSTGDLLRRLTREETPSGVEFRRYVAAGIAPPDESIIPIVLDTLAVRGGPYRRVLFDGFPRTLAQAQALDEALASAGACLEHVFYIYVSPQEAVARLLYRWICHQCGVSHALTGDGSEKRQCQKCGGALERRWGDGNPDILNARRQVFYTDTGPVLDHYEHRGRLCKLNGEWPEAEVAASALKTLSISATH